MILGGKRAGHVTRRSDYVVGDKLSFRTYLERGEGIARGNEYRLIEYFFIMVPLSYVKN
jgi:hypothetical protein